MSSTNKAFQWIIIAITAELLSLSVGKLSLADDATARARIPNEQAERLFTIKILPLLKSKCFGCHGEDPGGDVKGEFDIRSRAGLLRGGESGEATIVPGKPEDSSLFSAIQWEEYEMPPKENDRLTPPQIEMVRKWIAGGAPWPDEAAQDRIRKQDWSVIENEEGVIVPTSGGLADEWTYRRYKPEDIWAFQPLQRPEIPQVASHPIDAFISARLAAADLEPANTADFRTLIRRATYDLTGLPPTPYEIFQFRQAWEKDPEQAWDDLVTRLLNSKHYGERWGQHWLDVVRYADTAGFSNDYERSNAWRYRDYVIRSFNRDKPFNEFILEQIAGDEIERRKAEGRKMAGFRLHPSSFSLLN